MPRLLASQALAALLPNCRFGIVPQGLSLRVLFQKKILYILNVVSIGELVSVYKNGWGKANPHSFAPFVHRLNFIASGHCKCFSPARRERGIETCRWSRTPTAAKIKLTSLGYIFISGTYLNHL